MSSKHIDFYFDLSSPYSYLAATQLEAIANRHGATIAWKPLVLAAVFKAQGNVMPAVCVPKAQYMVKDLARWAEHYGVPFQMSSRFPLPTIRGMRLIIAAESSGRSGELAKSLFTGMWERDLDISSDAVLRTLVSECGLSADELMAATETSAVKDKLRAYTDEAISRGVFGAPAMMVDGELFWGNDRLHFLEQQLTK